MPIYISPNVFSRPPAAPPRRNDLIAGTVTESPHEDEYVSKGVATPIMLVIKRLAKFHLVPAPGCNGTGTCKIRNVEETQQNSGGGFSPSGPGQGPSHVSRSTVSNTESGGKR